MTEQQISTAESVKTETTNNAPKEYDFVVGKVSPKFDPSFIERAIPVTIAPSVLEQPNAAQVIALATTLSYLVVAFANAERIRTTRIELTTFADPEETQTQVVLEVCLPVLNRQTVALTMAFGSVMEVWIQTLAPDAKTIVEERIALDIRPDK